jgi:hypothetical protein
MAFAINMFAADDFYYPPSESARGWRWCKDKDQVRSLAGMDPERLNLIRNAQLQIYQGPWAIVIIRKGYLVAEWLGVPAMPNTTFDGWSSTKSATGIAFGLLWGDSRHNNLPVCTLTSILPFMISFLRDYHSAIRRRRTLGCDTYSV